MPLAADWPRSLRTEWHTLPQRPCVTLGGLPIECPDFILLGLAFRYHCGSVDSCHAKLPRSSRRGFTHSFAPSLTSRTQSDSSIASLIATRCASFSKALSVEAETTLFNGIHR